MFSHMAVTIQLPWLWIKTLPLQRQKKLLCPSHTFIQIDNISVAQWSPWRKMHFYLQNKALGTSRDQPTLSGYSPFYLKQKAAEPNFSNFLASQTQPCYMRCSWTQKKQTCNNIQKISIWTILLFYFPAHTGHFFLTDSFRQLVLYFN